MTLTIGSLCSGYGGLDQAVQAVLGGDLAWVADPDPGAAKILKHHHPDVPNLGDITAADWSTVPPVDLLTAGFPCQDLSVAGKGAGIADGTRSGLWLHVLRAIRILRPRLVVIENVPGLRTRPAHSDVEFCPGCMGDPKRVPALRALGAVLGGLADVGFDAEWTTVAASDVGAPHERQRVFLIAWPAEAPPDFSVRPADGQHGLAVPGDVTLLPTPVVADSQGTANFRAGGTPYGTGYGQTLTDAIRLLPTPRVSDSTGPGMHGQGGLDLRTAISLLPTPRASDGAHGGPNQRGSKGDLALPAAVQPEHFAQYAAAIARWEPTMGRQVPAPTDPTGKGGRPQLSPRFVEWAMGLPGGHVTAPEIGLTRAEQLHALGNGVVPQQGAAALRLLLERVTAEVAA